MGDSDHHPASRSGDATPGKFQALASRLQRLLEFHRSFVRELDELHTDIEQEAGQVIRYCDCCGRNRPESGRRYCSFCHLLFRRIAYVADRAGCPRPSDADRDTIVARIAATPVAAPYLASRFFLAFEFPESLFVSHSTLDYRLLFHPENLRFFVKRTAYDDHQAHLQSIRPDHLLSKFAVWSRDVVRITDTGSDIRRRTKP